MERDAEYYLKSWEIIDGKLRELKKHEEVWKENHWQSIVICPKGIVIVHPENVMEETLTFWVPSIEWFEFSDKITEETFLSESMALTSIRNKINREFNIGMYDGNSKHDKELDTKIDKEIDNLGIKVMTLGELSKVAGSYIDMWADELARVRGADKEYEEYQASVKNKEKFMQKLNAMMRGDDLNEI